MPYIANKNEFCNNDANDLFNHYIKNLPLYFDKNLQEMGDVSALNNSNPLSIEKIYLFLLDYLFDQIKKKCFFDNNVSNKDKLFEIMMSWLDLLAPYKNTLLIIQRNIEGNLLSLEQYKCIKHYDNFYYSSKSFLQHYQLLPNKLSILYPFGFLIILLSTTRYWLQDPTDDYSNTMVFLDNKLDQIIDFTNSPLKIISKFF